MVTVKDVPADLFLERLAKYLKESVPQVSPPPWSLFVKTGPNKERPPDREDWWYVRAASIMRKLYLHGPVGIERLRSAYSYRAKVGDKARSERTRKCGGAIIRNILHQLERAGLTAKTKEGRVLTPKGRKLMDEIAKQIFSELVERIPELKKYA